MNTKGFTLVELLGTIVVVAIASLGISSLFYNIQYLQRQSGYLDAATRAAQREVEVLRNSTYNSLPVGQTINFTADLPSTLPKNKSGTVVVSEPSEGIKRVDVTVSFNDGKKQNSVQLSSLIGVLGLAQ